MPNRFIYPIDTDQFVKIREQGKLYVDKTDLIYDIVAEKQYEYVFLARPRRFGKSLLCNTLHAYFEGRRELFEAYPEQKFIQSLSKGKGLKIAELEKEWIKYPVLHFDMSAMRNCKSLQDMREVLEAMLRDYEIEYGKEKDVNEIGKRFSSLIRFANKKTGKHVVVIIDEYDTPMLRNLYNKDMKDDIRTLMKSFYQTLKIEGAYLRFVFITGVTKFSQLSIFSELNNLKQISMFDEYSGLCGITQQELDTTLRPCVEDFAEAQECTVEEAYAILKKNYDGYHFSENSQDVYAPYSLLNALNDKKPNQYWFETGTPSSLIEHLKHFPDFNPLDYDGIKVGLDEFNMACEDATTPMPLLYQSGYLSIDKYIKKLDTYILHFPNMEVRNGMIKSLAPIVLKRQTADNNALVRQMAEGVFDGDISDALLALRAYIAGIPYDIITKDEWEKKEARESFYKLLFYIAFSMLNSLVDTEVKSILGRADVVIQTEDDVFVLELKVDDTVDNALQQIEDKSYAVQYGADTFRSTGSGQAGSVQVHRKVTKCGVSISSEARNITHWKVVDEKGKVIDEQRF